MRELRDVENDADFEHFLVRTRIDIVPVLQALCERGVELSVRISGLSGTLKTRLLCVKPEYEELVFDSQGEHGLEKLDGTQKLQAEGPLDTLHVVFGAGHVEAVVFQGNPAFRARLPGAIARIQRRSSVRHPVPSVNPPVCSIGMPD